MIVIIMILLKQESVFQIRDGSQGKKPDKVCCLTQQIDGKLQTICEVYIF